MRLFILSMFLLLNSGLPGVVHSQQFIRLELGQTKKISTRVQKKKRPACRDRRDNDRDGLTDFPADPGCKNKRDKRERNPKTVQPPVTPTSAATPTPGVVPTPGELGPGASLGGRRPFPDDNPWNTDISNSPLDPNSARLIASIGLDTGLHPDFGTVWENRPIGIPYTVVRGSQARIPVSFYYDDESDPGPYPIPADAPIEGGSDASGDRHILVLDWDNWMLYELYDAWPDGNGWRAGSGAIFNLNSNALRPAGWTSADAAGLPIFPGLVRYDEVIEQGEIRHALRFTVQRTRRAYVSPARHFASSATDPDLPPMGMRVRLKASFDISPFPAPVQVVLRALKQYGMFVADNGANWYITGAPDSRWNDEELASIRNVRGRDFEVVQMGEIITD